MPRKTPTTTVDVLGGFDARPIRDVGEYLASKTEGRWYMRAPYVDISSADLETFYIDRKSEYDVMQRQLAILRNEKCEQKQIYKSRIRLFQRSQAQLQSSFLGLNNFIRDSDEKKKEAIREINEQISIQKELKDSIETKRVAVKELSIFREELKRTTQEYAPYETLLEAAARKSPEYESVGEIINHCDAIMKINDEVDALEAKFSGEIKAMRKRVTDIVRQAELIVVGLKNILSVMHRAYTEAFIQCQKWEKKYAEVKSTIIENNDKKGRTLDGISFLYRLLCRRRDIAPEYIRSDVELELDFIRDEVSLLQEVLREFDKTKKVPNKNKEAIASKC